NQQFLDFINASNYTPIDTVNYLKHWINNKPAKSDLNKPVVNISYEDATAYAGYFLCKRRKRKSISLVIKNTYFQCASKGDGNTEATN
ncbi:MAG: hypothetical protein ACK42B_10050, partial [Chitinophagaceae bacterium]